MASRMLMETQSKTTYKRIAIVLTAMVGFILAGNAALTAAIVQLSQNVKVASDGKLQTASGDAMTVQSMPNVQTTMHSSRRRRLRMLDGRRRLEVAQVSEEMCNAAHTMATKSSMYEGFVKIDSDDGGETRFAHGDVVGQSSKSTYTLTGTDKGLGLTDTVDVTLSSGQPCSVSLPASRLRQLRALNEEEVRAYRRFRRRHRRLDQSAVQSLKMSGNFTVNKAPPCELYHCFDGDADCEYPSQEPEIDCMEWSEGSANDGRRCLDPMCALVQHVNHKKNERRLTHGWYADDGTALDSNDACDGPGEIYQGSCWHDDHWVSHADCLCQYPHICFSKQTTACRFPSPTANTCHSVLMTDLVSGDLVLGRNGATRVIAVHHKNNHDPARVAPMLNFHMRGRGKVSMTPDHGIFSDGKLVAASEVFVGSVLSGGKVERITKSMAGIVNPVTADATIVADGVLAASHPFAVAKDLIDAPTMRTILNACMYSVGDVDGFAEAGFIAGDFAARLGILAASLAAAIHFAKRVSKTMSRA